MTSLVTSMTSSMTMMVMVIMVTVSIDGQNSSRRMKFFDVWQGISGKLTKRAERMGPLWSGTATFLSLVLLLLLVILVTMMEVTMMLMW